MILAAVVTVLFAYRLWRPPNPGPVMLKCSSCGSRMYRNLPPWWYRASWIPWFAIAFTALAPIFQSTNLAIFFGLGLPVCVAWVVAERRVYHWWWMRWHPTRCQGAGHAEPEGAGV